MTAVKKIRTIDYTLQIPLLEECRGYFISCGLDICEASGAAPRMANYINC